MEVAELMPKPKREKPKDIEYRFTYEPDMDRMVKALMIVLQSRPEKKADKEVVNQ
jgi:hypothetical protein